MIAKPEETGMRKSDRLIPWYFVLFFMVVGAVNAVFITEAIRTLPGVVAEHPYQEGLKYNTLLEQAARQKAAGWQSSLDLVNGTTLTFSLRDKYNAPVVGADIKAHIIRAVRDGHDFFLPLTEGKPGIYASDARFPLPGAWTVSIEAKWQNNRYYMEKMIQAP